MLALTLRTFDRITELPVRRALAAADIEIDGHRPWDIRVNDPAFYLRMMPNPAFQIGQTYMDGMWDCDAIDEMVFKLIASRVYAQHEKGGVFHLRNALARVRNMQSRARAGEVALAHYDLDLDLYRGMLDETLTYTCAYWDAPGATLADAQRAKLRLICDKLELKPGQTLLDIGCGFGGLAAFAAEHYGVKTLGVTNSQQHCTVARTLYPHLELALMDYRELPALGRRFDAVASVEMIEAVGPKNFTTYFDVVSQCLAPRGAFLLQSFISPASRFVCNEWFDRYIFPNGVVPSFPQLHAASAMTFGAPTDVHELGLHYPSTLLAWDRNLRATWPRLRSRNDERFRRMWHFYLTSLAGVFRAEDLRLCQVLYRK
jgi:cyclopropane-fatty-acyl-phospholipid synthase